MGIFKGKYHYPTPERLSKEEARSRRLTALLEKEQRFAELPNFNVARERLQAAERSRVTQKILAAPEGKQLVKDHAANGPKAASIAAALGYRRPSDFTERDFGNPLLRAAYREQRRRQEGYRKVSPIGVDNRQFNPTGKGAWKISGSPARFTRALNAESWLPAFKNPAQVIPCVQRSVRRQVMFALGFGGRGYHSKKRRNANSGIPC